MRIAHYWTSLKSSAVPSSILCYDTETWHGESVREGGKEWQTLRLGYAMAYRLEGTKRTRQSECRFSTPTEFWTFLESRLNTTRPLWVFAHNAAYDFSVVAGWDWLQQPGYYVSKFILERGIFHLEVDTPRGRVVFSDSCNYYKCSLRRLGKSIGIPKLDMPPQTMADKVWMLYCQRDVEITARAMDSLIHYVVSNDLCPWQITIASLAFAAYRCSFMKHRVLVHDKTPALEVERASYYGGLVATNFIGPVPSTEVYCLDVVSMYPFQCLKPLPYHIVGYEKNPTMDRVKSNLKNYMGYAKVTLHTTEYPYPIRHEGKLIYPVGLYTTFLPHPELCHAIECGHVVHIHEISYHQSAPIFADYMKHFAKEKVEYKAKGNDAWSTIAKYLMNSLYGKTGQKSSKWWTLDARAIRELEATRGIPNGVLDCLINPMPEIDGYEEEYAIPDLDFSCRLRNWFGITEVDVGEQESRDSYPAIAATVTSYARMHLRRLHAIAGVGNWYYSDTDSIFVNREGKENLEKSGLTGTGQFGTLECKGPYANLVVHGRKDYELDGIVTLKGIRTVGEDGTPRANEITPGAFEQPHFPSAKSLYLADKWGGVMVEYTVKHLRRVVDWCEVCPDGYTRPITLVTQ